MFAKTGHIFQVHHRADCVEFVLLEDALATGCLVYNPSNSLGIESVDDACLANQAPWYGIATGQGPGQTPLTVDQLPAFMASMEAINTAYKLNSIVEMLLDVPINLGVAASTVEQVQFATNSAIGLDPTSVTLQCKNLGALSGKHTTTVVGNINTPPDPNQ